MSSTIHTWPNPEFKAFRDLLLKLRFIDRDHLPATRDWDIDWPLFRDDPWRYLISGPDKHQRDIWFALTVMSEQEFNAITFQNVKTIVAGLLAS